MGIKVPACTQAELRTEAGHALKHLPIGRRSRLRDSQTPVCQQAIGCGARTQRGEEGCTPDPFEDVSLASIFVKSACFSAWYKYLQTSCALTADHAGGTTSSIDFPAGALPFQAVAPTSSTILWLVLLALYIAFFLVALWVHNDARIRGMRGPFWFLISFGIPIGGFAAYLILRKERHP
jgi:hypothetical protein